MRAAAPPPSCRNSSRTISARPSYSLSGPWISTTRFCNARTSPMSFKCPENTTTVNGQTRKSSQKSKNVAPRLPRFTRKTLPVMHWVSPMCSCACSIGKQLAKQGRASTKSRMSLEATSHSRAPVRGRDGSRRKKTRKHPKMEKADQGHPAGMTLQQTWIVRNYLNALTAAASSSFTSKTV